MLNLFRPWISSDRNEKTPTKSNLSETSPIGKGAKLRKQSVMIVTLVKTLFVKLSQKVEEEEED
ncbi:hypothetical protein C0J52_28147 [Blattella germanica]|nr:hypothetical protein C0J52_28146 [Blattella germanica]PSN29232.1 hypothetical protein C0J52_28147 [Blattella germanica]